MKLGRLLAVDPSLTCSGWALFSIHRERIVSIGKIRSLPAQEPLASRYTDLQSKIESLFAKLELKVGDILVCEAPTTMRDPQAAFKVEQVRGIFETVARTKQVLVPGRLNPRSVQQEIMGLSGKQRPRHEVKRTATTIVKSLYSDNLLALGFEVEFNSLSKHQDIIDAILVGNLALTRIRSARLTNSPIEELFREKPRRKIGAKCLEANY